MQEPPRPPDTPEPAAANEYLRELAMAELGQVRAVLAATGHELESARARSKAAEAEFSAQMGALQFELAECRSELENTRTALQVTRDELKEARDEATAAATQYAATAEAHRDHIARLKTQIQSPWRLVAKWFLRRGPYARSTRSAG